MADDGAVDDAAVVYSEVEAVALCSAEGGFKPRQKLGHEDGATPLGAMPIRASSAATIGGKSEGNQDILIVLRYGLPRLSEFSAVNRC